MTFVTLIDLARHCAIPLLRIIPEKVLSPTLQFARDGWNKKLYKGLDLSPDSKVLDIGGFVGDSTEAILSRFSCRIFVFEPVPEFQSVLRSRFEGNGNVTVFGFGIAAKNSSRSFLLDGDKTGFTTNVDSNRRTINVEFRSVEEVAQLIGWDNGSQIALAIINIEGGEYELLPLLHEQQRLKFIKSILIQFHQVSESSEEQRSQVYQYLAESHRRVWGYDWVWERWDLIQ